MIPKHFSILGWCPIRLLDTRPICSTLNLFLQTKLFPNKNRQGRPHCNGPWWQILHLLASPLCKNKWHVKNDMWHVTCHMWHVTQDMWHVRYEGRLTLSQNSRFLAHSVWEWRCFEHIWTKRITHSMNWITIGKCVCTTALTTPYTLPPPLS